MFEGGLGQIDQPLREFIADRLSPPLGINSPEELDPRIQVKDHEYRLGSIALSEGYALLMEMGTSTGFPCLAGRNWTVAFERIGHMFDGRSEFDYGMLLDYTAAILHYHALLGERATPWTFFALTDLAFMGPLGEFFEDFPNCGWRDQHPGWRFVRAVEVARSIEQIHFPDRKSYVAFVEQLCADERLNWPPPWETARRGVEFLDGIAPKAGDPFVRFHLALMNARCARPELFCNPSGEAHRELWQACPPPMNLPQVSEHVIGPIPVVVLAALQNLARQVLSGPRLTCPKVLCASCHLRQPCCDQDISQLPPGHVCGLTLIMKSQIGFTPQDILYEDLADARSS
jgi:hypothetical protein